MMLGGVTPFGLPDNLPLWIDARVMEPEWVILGGGAARPRSKAAPESCAGAGRRGRRRPRRPSSGERRRAGDLQLRPPRRSGRRSSGRPLRTRSAASASRSANADLVLDIPCGSAYWSGIGARCAMWSCGRRRRRCRTCRRRGWPGTGRRGWRSTARRPTAPRPGRGRSSGWRRRRRVHRRPPHGAVVGAVPPAPGTDPTARRSAGRPRRRGGGGGSPRRCPAAARTPRRRARRGGRGTRSRWTPTIAPLARSSVWRAPWRRPAPSSRCPPRRRSRARTTPSARRRPPRRRRRPHSMSSGWATITVALLPPSGNGPRPVIAAR